jgi:hypothetical protein
MNNLIKALVAVAHLQHVHDLWISANMALAHGKTDWYQKSAWLGLAIYETEVELGWHFQAPHSRFVFCRECHGDKAVRGYTWVTPEGAFKTPDLPLSHCHHLPLVPFFLLMSGTGRFSGKEKTA